MQVNRGTISVDPSAIVFASGANLHKLRPELLHVWAKILAQVPDSVLLLFPYGPNWSSTYPKKPFMNLFVGICGEYGVDANRLRILDQTPPPRREDIRELANDLRFRLSFPGVPKDKTPVILLDLRLFSGNIKKEQNFFEGRVTEYQKGSSLGDVHNDDW